MIAAPEIWKYDKKILSSFEGFIVLMFIPVILTPYSGDADPPHSGSVFCG